MLVSVREIAATPEPESPTEAAHPAGPADHTEDLVRLAEAGIPEMKGAVWVNLPNLPADPGYRAAMRESDASFYGGSFWSFWIVPSGRADETTVIRPGKAVFETYRRSATPSSDGDFATALSKAVPGRFDDYLAGRLTGIGKQVVAYRTTEASFANRRSDRMAGGALVFAAQLYRVGDIRNANRVADAVFRGVADYGRAMDAALSTIADARFEAASDALASSGDWSAYATALDALIARFGAHWDRLREMRSLAQKVKLRVEMKVLPVPVAPDGMTPTPEAVAAFDGLCAAGSIPVTPPDRVAGTLWLLPRIPPDPDEPPETDYFWGGMGPPREPLLRHSSSAALLRLGRDAVPVLIAGANDETLTSILSNPRVSEPFSDPDSEAMLRAKTAVRYPMTRGEASLRLLAAAIPVPRRFSWRANPAAARPLRETAIAFWRNHAGDPPAALLWRYLDGGDQRQRLDASAYLDRCEDGAMAASFVTVATNAPPSPAATEAIIGLAARAGSAGKEFARPYLEMLRTTKPEYGNNDAAIRRLEAAMLEKPLAERLMETAVTPGPPSATLVQCLAAAEGMREARGVPLLLQAATSVRSQEAEVLCLRTILGVFARRRHESSAVGRYRLPSPGSEEAARWKTLIAGRTPFYPDWSSPAIASGVVYARLFETLWGEIPDEADRYADRLDGGAVYVRRAIARLDGKPVPDWPDAATVSPERLAAIASIVVSAAEEGRESPRESFTESEKLAWMIAYDTHGFRDRPARWDDALELRLKACDARFLGAATRYEKGEPLSAEDAALTREILELPALKPAKGLDQKWFEPVAKALVGDPRRWSGTVLTFVARDPFSPGVRCFASRPELRKYVPPERREDRAPGRGLRQRRITADFFKRDHDLKDADALVTMEWQGALYKNVSGAVRWLPRNSDSSVMPAVYGTVLAVLTREDAAIIRGD